MKKIIAFIIAIAVIAAAGIFLKKQKEKVSHLNQPKIFTHSVKIIQATQQTLDKKREFLAQILSSNSAFIASKFSANIKKIYVNENDQVKKGQLLISLDDSEIQANLASLYEQERALKADVANTKRVLERNKKLYAIKAISKEALDNTQVMYQNKLSALKTIDEKIKQTKATLHYLNIKAPFDGRIGSKLADDGSLALPGKPILTLNSDDQKLIFSFVDGNEPIIEGQKVYLNNKLIGEVIKRYDDAKNSLLVAEVKPYKPLAIANKSFVTINVVTDSAIGCTIPNTALLHKKDGIYIVVYQDNKFHFQKIKLILENSQKSIISPCPKEPIATASEAKLAILPSFGKVLINGEEK